MLLLSPLWLLHLAALQISISSFSHITLAIWYLPGPTLILVPGSLAVIYPQGRWVKGWAGTVSALCCCKFKMSAQGYGVRTCYKGLAQLISSLSTADVWGCILTLPWRSTQEQTLVFQLEDPHFHRSTDSTHPPGHPVLQEHRAGAHLAPQDTGFRQSNTITWLTADLWSVVGWKTNQIRSCVYDLLYLTWENWKIRQLP